MAVRDEAHPLFVKDVRPGDIAGHVATDRVAEVFSSVRVELAALVALNQIYASSVEKTVDLNIERGLDEL